VYDISFKSNWIRYIWSRGAANFGTWRR